MISKLAEGNLDYLFDSKASPGLKKEETNVMEYFH